MGTLTGNPIIDSLIRTLLTSGGTYLAAKGYFDSNTVNDVVGALMIIGATIWSVLHHSAAITATAVAAVTPATTTTTGTPPPAA